MSKRPLIVLALAALGVALLWLLADGDGRGPSTGAPAGKGAGRGDRERAGLALGEAGDRRRLVETTELAVEGREGERTPAVAEPDFFIRVAVRNEAGAGVAQRELRIVAPDEEHGGWILLARLTTDAEGRAVYAIDEEPEEFCFQEGPVRLARDRWFGDEEHFEVEPEDFRAHTEFVFEEASTGDLEFVLREPDGGSLATPVEIIVVPASDPELLLRHVSAMRTEDTWRLLGVPLGVRFDVLTRRSTDRDSKDGPGKWFRGRMGPTRSGQRVEHVLNLDPPALQFTGRAVSAEGEPVVREALTVTLHERADLGRIRTLEVRTGAAGELRFGLVHPDREERAVHRVLLRREHDGGSAMFLPAVDSRRESAIPMGELRFERGRLLASGRVLDSDGQPRPGVQLQVQARGVPAGVEEERWVEFEPGHDARTRTDGTFELRGPWLPERLRVFTMRYERRWYRAWSSDLSPGARSLELQLEPLGDR